MDTTRPIIDTTTHLFRHADRHEWDQLAGVFAEEVDLDYTSLAGGAPARLTPDEIIAAWRPGFEAIDAHQHLVANHLVDQRGDAATVTATFIATHQWAGETWTLGGDYTFELAHTDAWRITAMTMTAIWQTGDPTLLARATT
ncbi:MAG: nuclear transport factor 2 family protein [Actinomycetota bacterium]